MADKVKSITIDDKKYALDSLSEKCKVLLSTLQRCEELISQKQFELSIAHLGRAKLLDEIAEEVPNLVQVE
jgi:hypothetical protein